MNCYYKHDLANKSTNALARMMTVRKTSSTRRLKNLKKCTPYSPNVTLLWSTMNYNEIWRKFRIFSSLDRPFTTFTTLNLSPQPRGVKISGGFLPLLELFTTFILHLHRSTNISKPCYPNYTLFRFVNRDKWTRNQVFFCFVSVKVHNKVENYQ